MLTNLDSTLDTMAKALFVGTLYYDEVWQEYGKVVAANADNLFIEWSNPEGGVAGNVEDITVESAQYQITRGDWTLLFKSDTV